MRIKKVEKKPEVRKPKKLDFEMEDRIAELTVLAERETDGQKQNDLRDKIERIKARGVLE